MLGGMAWAAVPAVLKVKTGAHEVVTTIMMNGIAVSLLGVGAQRAAEVHDARRAARSTSARDTSPTNALVPDLGHHVRHAANRRTCRGCSRWRSWPRVVVWFLIRRMRLGYEARAVGSSAGSARAGGISIGAVQIKLFLISGALAGLVGMQQLLADKGYLGANYEAQLGFTGIAVAFLGQNNPSGSCSRSILWGILSRGETALQIETDVPREFVIILQGILILSVVIIYQIAQRRLARQLARMPSGSRRQSELAARGGLMPFEDIAVARPDRVHVLHAHLPDRSRRVCSASARAS